MNGGQSLCGPQVQSARHVRHLFLRIFLVFFDKTYNPSFFGGRAYLYYAIAPLLIIKESVFESKVGLFPAAPGPLIVKVDICPLLKFVCD